MNVYEVEYTLWNNHEWNHDTCKRIVTAESEIEVKQMIESLSDMNYERTVERIRQIEVGDKVKIIKMKDYEKYNNTLGEITSIDSLGQLHGTWGGLALIPGEDDFKVM